MSKIKPDIRIGEVRQKEGSYLCRAVIMYVQQKRLSYDMDMCNELKDVTAHYGGIFKKSNPLACWDTYELKAEIRHRTGLPYNYKKDERKKYG